jgi:hypothetical protein
VIYRDDREALRARVRQLEAELERARMARVGRRIAPAALVPAALALAAAGVAASVIAAATPAARVALPLPPCDGAVLVSDPRGCAPPPCSAEVLRRDGSACVDCPLRPRWDAEAGKPVLACEDRFPEGWSRRCEHHGRVLDHEVWCRPPAAP